MAKTDPHILRHQRSVRTNFSVWMLLLVGAVFVYGGYTIDPQTNCSEDGSECAPWLVPLAAGFGLLAVGGALSQLIVNPLSGSVTDLRSGKLIWWKNRTRRHVGDTGETMASAISLIRICRESESADSLHVYDLQGERLHFLDEECVAFRMEKWAEALVAHWPHIKLEIRD